MKKPTPGKHPKAKGNNAKGPGSDKSAFGGASGGKHPKAQGNNPKLFPTSSAQGPPTFGGSN